MIEHKGGKSRTLKKVQSPQGVICRVEKQGNFTRGKKKTGSGKENGASGTRTKGRGGGGALAPSRKGARKKSKSKI